MVASAHRRSLMRRRTIPKFKSDREAAAFWDRHASTSYLSDLEEVTVRVIPALRRQIAARARGGAKRHQPSIWPKPWASGSGVRPNVS